jgi:hypothetical protein
MLKISLKSVVIHFGFGSRGTLSYGKDSDPIDFEPNPDSNSSLRIRKKIILKIKPDSPPPPPHLHTHTQRVSSLLPCFA